MAKLLLFALVLVFAFSGSVCSETLLIMGRVEEALEINGEVEGYPKEPWEQEPYKLYLAHDGEKMYVHLSVKTGGWIAIGFNNPGGGMHGSNMFIGYFDGEEGLVRDDVAVGRTHSAVDEPAIEEFFITREDDLVIMEFSYPLQFPEDQGYNLSGLSPEDSFGIILAYHNSSQNIRTRHSSRASLNAEVEYIK